ncbi:MAG: alkaline phosphatase family protein, partial [Ilumatobacteraceae bacterium]
MSGRNAPRVMYIGLDACDAGIIERLARQGRCPTFASLFAEAAVVPTVAPYGTFVGSSWMTITMGRDVARHRYWNWTEVDPQTYEAQGTTPRSAVGVPFWEQVAGAGHRVAVLDVPHMGVPESFNGVMLKEWGCHDRHDGTAAYPPALLDELDQLVGRHPLGCRDHPGGSDAFAPCDYTLRDGAYRNLDEEHRLADLLRAGVDAKHRATVHLLDKERWDLFISVLGEGHCAGHQFWHVHDPAHPRHD